MPAWNELFPGSGPAMGTSGNACAGRVVDAFCRAVAAGSLGGTLHPVVGDVVRVAEAEKVADLVQRRRLGAGRDRRHSSAR